MPLKINKPASITLKIFYKNQIQTVSEMWQGLEKQINPDSITSDWDWVKTWIDNYQELVDYFFVLGFVENDLVAAVLVVRETNRLLPFPVKAFHIGTNGEPFQDQVKMIDNVLLVKKEYKNKFVIQLIEFITNNFDWEEIVFDDLLENEAKTILDGLNNKYKIKLSKKAMLIMDFTKIRDSKDDLFAYFSHSMRRYIRRSIRAYKNDLLIEWAKDEKQALDFLDQLITFYQKTWQKLGRSGMFSSKPFNHFQHQIIKKLIIKNKVILIKVSSKKYGTIGILYLFSCGKMTYSYQIGVNQMEDFDFESISHNRLKTGYLIHALAMEECFKHNFNYYNFSTGLYPYKKSLTNSQSSTVTISVRQGPKPAIRDFIINSYIKLDSNKRSPVLLKIIRNVLKR